MDPELISCVHNGSRSPWRVPCGRPVPVHRAGKNQGLDFQKRSTPAAQMAAAASNPGDRGVAPAAGAPDSEVDGTDRAPAGRGDKAVAKSLVVPAVIETGAARSWYPSCFRSTVWLPVLRPGMVAGLTPRRTPSI